MWEHLGEQLFEGPRDESERNRFTGGAVDRVR